jgi:DNA-binding transcriptional LysR family regulator
MRNKRDYGLRTGFDELAAASAFLQIVETRNFSVVAKLTGKSTSTLSRQIAQLEQFLGAQLMTRTTRRLSLTEAGALYAKHAGILLTSQRSAHEAISELTGGIPRGHLRVSMPVTVGERLLASHLPGFQLKYPELRLQLDLSDRNVPLVAGGFDLAIRVGPLQDSSLRAQLLGRVPVMLVASPEYLAKRDRPKRPVDLLAHNCVTVAQTPGPIDWKFFHRRTKQRSEEVRIDGVVTTTSPTLATTLACNGVGVLRIIEWMVQDQLASGALVETMTDWSCNRHSTGGAPAYILYSQQAGVEPPLKSRVFVELVKQVFKTVV